MVDGQQASFLLGENPPKDLRLSWSGKSVFGYSGRSPEKSDSDHSNEDAALVFKRSEDEIVLAVADGAGGLPSGSQASRIAIESLYQALMDIHEDPQALLRSAIITGLDRGDETIRELGVGAGTTMTVVCIEHGLMRAFHVGDSGALVTGSRGKIKFQTIAHSPTGYAVASGMMGDKEALTHEDRHFVSNLLGREDMRIEIGNSITLSPQDTVLLASDGLTDNLTTGEIVEFVRKGELNSAAQRLQSLALHRMQTESIHKPSKPDDMTFLLYRPR
ncbi:MAG: PP2C family serine/threonine-protein phosphatase [Pseudomonadota bacterium]